MEVDEAFFGGRTSMNEKYRKIPVFGMKFRDGEARMIELDKVNTKTLTKAIVSNVKFGSTIYSDAYSGYKHLSNIGYDHKVINHRICFAKGNTHTNGIEGLWSFVKTNLAKYRGVTRKNFHLYLCEQQLRFNTKNGDLFEILMKELLKMITH